MENIEDVSTIYRQHPLSANTTRVFHILPATKPDQSNIISCRLSVISLSPSRPEYRAHSYVWGDPSVTRTILLDNTEFEIRINLWTYLLQARKERYTDPLWVDAICINQEDLNERSSQVAIMRQIYSKALEVRAWLGTGTTSSLEAMRCLSEINWQEEAVKISDLNGLEHYYRQVRESLLEISELEYWSRVWIMQEYVLARSVMIQCGPNFITGDEFYRLSRIAVAYPSDRHGIALPIIQARVDRIGQESSPAGFEFAIILSQSLDNPNSKCTNLHDHVYALLSLNKAASLEIVPDYTKSLYQLFLEFVHFFKTKPVLPHKRINDLLFVVLAVERLKNRWELADCAEAIQASQDLSKHLQRLRTV